MSQLEDEIRDSLRSEADRLREVRPLYLPPAATSLGRRRALRERRARWQRPWQAPVMAAAAIVLVAGTLVTAKMMRNGSVVPAPGPGPATASPASSAIPDVTPRYYVRFGWATTPAGKPTGIATMVGDVQTGKTLGSFSLPNGESYDWAASGAADDRTFVVFAGVFRSVQDLVPTSAKFYLVKIFPGSADPVRVTPLAIQDKLVTAATGVTSMALSADGSELAVVYHTGKSIGLGVYSVATGRRQHVWSAALSAGLRPRWEALVTNPSWVGDGTVAFAFIQTPNVRQEVRTLDVNSPGTSLLTDSRVVWSQYVPPPAGGKGTPRTCATLLACGTSSTYGKGTPRTCDTPFLTGDGLAVVCGIRSYSASTKRLSAAWLAYPLAAPGRPRVIGTATVRPDAVDLNGPVAVEWTNSSGTEVIGSWNPQTVLYDKTGQVSGGEVTNYFAFIGGGKISPFPWAPGLEGAAW